MTVSELIQKLLEECEVRGANPDTTEVEIIFDGRNELLYDVDSYGGNDYPLVVVIK